MQSTQSVYKLTVKLVTLPSVALDLQLMLGDTLLKQALQEQLAAFNDTLVDVGEFWICRECDTSLGCMQTHVTLPTMPQCWCLL